MAFGEAAFCVTTLMLWVSPEDSSSSLCSSLCSMLAASSIDVVKLLSAGVPTVRLLGLRMFCIFLGGAKLGGLGRFSSLFCSNDDSKTCVCMWCGGGEGEEGGEGENQ